MDLEIYKNLVDLNFCKIKEIYSDLIKISKMSICGKYSKRIFCELHFVDGTKKHTQVARVLLESKLGRMLTKIETVDHIDGDSLNNSMDNLQMLSRSDNAKKGPSENNKKTANIKIGISNSGRCKGSGQKLSLLQIEEIKNSSISNRKLGVQYGVNHSLISRIKNNKIWK